MNPPAGPERGGIFRKSAVSRLASPDRLDVLAEVVTPQSRLAVGVLFACVVATVVWGFVGSIPTKVRAPCAITRVGGAVEVTAGSRGRIAEFRVQEGDRVRAGDVLARIEQPELSSLVRSTHPGRVLAVAVSGVGAQVDVATPLLTMEPEATGLSQQLEVVIFAPPGAGNSVRAGMDVQISPADVRREEAGFLVGKVRWVDDYPSSLQEIARVTQDERLARQLSAGGAPRKVLADLVADASAPSGYRWSSGRGPQRRIVSGTFCEAAITIERRKPITLVLPLLRQSFGIR